LIEKKCHEKSIQKMNSSEAYELRSADIPFDRRVHEFIELVNMLPTSW